MSPVRALAACLLVACRDGDGRERRDRPPVPEPAIAPVPTSTADTGPPPGPVAPPECLEPPPARARRVETITLPSEEDFDFDDRGRRVAQRTYQLVAFTRDLTEEVVAPFPWTDPAGFRVLPDGRLLVVEQNAGAVRVFDPATGASEVVLGGLTKPNGLVIERTGRAYASELARGGRVISFDPDTGDTAVVDTFRQPNALALSPDEGTLHVTTVAGTRATTIVAIDRADDGTFRPEDRRDLWSGDHELLSLAVDVCGNLYGASYSRDTLVRISPDGVAVEIGEARGGSSHSAVRFAPGLGGWERTHLHVNARSANRIDILDVGLPGCHLLVPDLPPSSR